MERQHSVHPEGGCVEVREQRLTGLDILPPQGLPECHRVDLEDDGVGARGEIQIRGPEDPCGITQMDEAISLVDRRRGDGARQLRARPLGRWDDSKHGFHDRLQRRGERTPAVHDAPLRDDAQRACLGCGALGDGVLLAGEAPSAPVGNALEPGRHQGQSGGMQPRARALSAPVLPRLPRPHHPPPWPARSALATSITTMRARVQHRCSGR